MEKTKNELLAEIASLQESVRTLQAKLENQQHLASAVEAKDKEMNTLSQQLSTKWQKQLDEKQAVITQLAQFIQAYQQNYRSFLKNVQGGLEIAVELEAVLSEKLNKK